jgi:hypothetical protein
VHRSLVPRSALVFFVVFSCAAQSSDSGSQSENAKPAAQSPPAPKTTTPKDQPGDKDKKKPKKIWTDEEISNVRGTVSVVGDANASNSSNQSSGSSSVSWAHDATWYRNKLAPLRTQVSDLDREIHQLKGSKGSVRENIESQVQIRETKRNKLQAQIDEIEDDARRHGIAAGDLR